jgi:ABC-type sugar transport system ATPase subunit
MLRAVELSKNYNGQIALDALNLNIEAGEVYCLLGANGAGKTTTINLFLNFIEPSGGHALINGLDVTREPLETKKYLAYIPEQVNLYKNLSGLENLEYFSALAGQDNYSKDELRAFLIDAGLQPDAALIKEFPAIPKECDKKSASPLRRQASQSSAARRTDFRFRPESLERILRIAKKIKLAGLRRFDGDARSFPRQRIGNA